MSDALKSTVDNINDNQDVACKQLCELTMSLKKYSTEMSEHVASTNKRFAVIARDMKDIRKEHDTMIGEVKEAVIGLHHIANEVKRFYAEFKEDRKEQMSMIHQNNVFRDRLLGGVGAVALLGTLITIAINIDPIKNLF